MGRPPTATAHPKRSNSPRALCMYERPLSGLCLSRCSASTRGLQVCPLASAVAVYATDPPLEKESKGSSSKWPTTTATEAAERTGVGRVVVEAVGEAGVAEIMGAVVIKTREATVAVVAATMEAAATAAAAAATVAVAVALEAAVVLVAVAVAVRFCPSLFLGVLFIPTASVRD